MKNTIRILIAIFFNLPLYGQQVGFCFPSIKISYDNSGNTIYRNSYAFCKLEDSDSLNPPTHQNLASQPNYEVKLYPNPTKGEMLAEATWDFMLLDNRMVYIFGMKGEMLYKSNISETKFPLDFTTFAPGYYIVQVSANGYNWKWKVQRE